MSESTEILDSRMASALFLNMIVQQTNMALIFLGKTPNPETGQLMQDLQTAKILIDQLEMLAIKTKGNLNPQESALMNQSLAAVRMSFVEAVEHGPKISPESATKHATEEAAAPGSAGVPPDQAQAQEPPKPAEAPSATQSPEDSESRKKFSKKY
jgi:hypothetical protein